MVTLAVASSLLGALLGFRFKVYILIPAIFFAVGLVIFADLERGYGGWWLAISAGIVTVGIQVGYLVGSAVPILLAPKHTDQYSPGHVPPEERHGSRAL
jgi:hypothetical protein